MGFNSLYFFYVAKKEGEQHQPKLLDQREQKTAFAKLKFLNNAKSFYWSNEKAYNYFVYYIFLSWIQIGATKNYIDENILH